MICRRSFADSSTTRRASSSRVGFEDRSSGSGSSRGLFNDAIGGMSYNVGGCNPGEFIHSSRWIAVFACRALRSQSPFDWTGWQFVGSRFGVLCERGEAIFQRLRLPEASSFQHDGPP